MSFDETIRNAREKFEKSGLSLSIERLFRNQPPARASIVISEQCFYCSKWYTPAELRTIGESVKMCEMCQHHHVKNMMEFEPPPYCQGCMTTTLALAARGDDRLAVHFKDGVYQVLCMVCDAAYVQQRKDLFAKTRFGYQDRKL